MVGRSSVLCSQASELGWATCTNNALSNSSGRNRCVGTLSLSPSRRFLFSRQPLLLSRRQRSVPTSPEPGTARSRASRTRRRGRPSTGAEPDQPSFLLGRATKPTVPVANPAEACGAQDKKGERPSRGSGAFRRRMTGKAYPIRARHICHPVFSHLRKVGESLLVEKPILFTRRSRGREVTCLVHLVHTRKSRQRA